MAVTQPEWKTQTAVIAATPGNVTTQWEVARGRAINGQRPGNLPAHVICKELCGDLSVTFSVLLYFLSSAFFL